MRTEPLRSHRWFAGSSFDLFIARSWTHGQWLPDRVVDGRPVIGICSPLSEPTPSNADLGEHVKGRVIEAGGLPVEFPVMSLRETLAQRTSTSLRNVFSADAEKPTAGNPIDGVVLLCSCDSTTPALLMGATSCDLPTFVACPGTACLTQADQIGEHVV